VYKLIFHVKIIKKLILNMEKNCFLEKILILTLLFFLINLKVSLACHLEQGTYYTDANCQNSINAYDWSWDFGGCDEGISAGQLYKKGLFGLTCEGPEAKWKKYPGRDGEICKVRWGMICDGTFEGKYDESEGRCVMCEGAKQVKSVKCGESDRFNVECESACGSPKECDDTIPGEKNWCESNLAKSCNENCEVVTKNCDEDDCKTGITCSGEDTNTLTISGDDYSCKDGDCSIVGRKTCETHVCDASKVNTFLKCGEKTYYCCLINENYKWRALPCEKVEKPDLVIIDIIRKNSKIHYILKNQGDATAGNSISRLWIDGEEKAIENVGNIEKEATYEGSFDFNWECSGENDNIKVCADANNNVDESDENNNCREETWSCTACSYSLKIDPSYIKDSAEPFILSTFSINATDDSSSVCPSAITYTIEYSAFGYCYEASVDRNSFTLNRGSTLISAFKVSMATYGECTMNVNIKDPNGEVVATGKYTLIAKWPPCEGDIKLKLDPSEVTVSGKVNASSSGFTSCTKRMIKIAKDSCNGPPVCTYPVEISYCIFDAPSTVGTYTYCACVDKNIDGDFDDVGESDCKNLKVKLRGKGCEPIYWRGNPTEKFDIVFVGYNWDNLDEMFDKAREHVDKWFSLEPINSHKDKFNVWVITTNQLRGKDCYSEGRCMICDEQKLIPLVSSLCPFDEGLIVVLLSPSEGWKGCAWRLYVTSGSVESTITSHELGHSFGNLMDEYCYEPTPVGCKPRSVQPWGPNCDVSGCKKWSSYESTCIPECTWGDLCRPSVCSIMRNNVLCFYFNEPSRRALLDRLNSISSLSKSTSQPVPAMLIDLNYDDERISINNLLLTSSFIPSYSLEKERFHLDVVGKEETLYSITFPIPNKLLWDEFKDTGEISGGILEREKFNFTLLLPYYGEEEKMEIFNSKGTKVLTVDTSKLEEKKIAISLQECYVNKECKAKIFGCKNNLFIALNKKGNPLGTIIVKKGDEVSFIPKATGEINLISVCFEPLTTWSEIREIK
jgi:hypothetical protein